MAEENLVPEPELQANLSVQWPNLCYVLDETVKKFWECHNQTQLVTLTWTANDRVIKHVTTPAASYPTNPTEVVELSGQRVMSIARDPCQSRNALRSFMLALTARGTLLIGIARGTLQTWIKLDLGEELFTQISAGSEHSAAIDIKGTLWMFGMRDRQVLFFGNLLDALGARSKSDLTILLDKFFVFHVKLPSGVRVVQCAHFATAAITYDGDLYVWGRVLHRSIRQPMLARFSWPVVDLAIGCCSLVVLNNSGQVFMVRRIKHNRVDIVAIDMDEPIGRLWRTTVLVMEGAAVKPKGERTLYVWIGGTIKQSTLSSVADALVLYGASYQSLDITRVPNRFNPPVSIRQPAFFIWTAHDPNLYIGLDYESMRFTPYLAQFIDFARIISLHDNVVHWYRRIVGYRNFYQLDSTSLISELCLDFYRSPMVRSDLYFRQAMIYSLTNWLNSLVTSRVIVPGRRISRVLMSSLLMMNTDPPVTISQQQLINLHRRLRAWPVNQPSIDQQEVERRMDQARTFVFYQYFNRCYERGIQPPAYIKLHMTLPQPQPPVAQMLGSRGEVLDVFCPNDMGGFNEFFRCLLRGTGTDEALASARAIDPHTFAPIDPGQQLAINLVRMRLVEPSDDDEESSDNSSSGTVTGDRNDQIDFQVNQEEFGQIDHLIGNQNLVNGLIDDQEEVDGQNDDQEELGAQNDDQEEVDSDLDEEVEVNVPNDDRVEVNGQNGDHVEVNGQNDQLEVNDQNNGQEEVYGQNRNQEEMDSDSDEEVEAEDGVLIEDTSQQRFHLRLVERCIEAVAQYNEPSPFPVLTFNIMDCILQSLGKNLNQEDE